MDDIRQHLAFLCYDLRTFSANKDAERRLNKSLHTHFLGPPYLTETQAELVRACPLSELRRRSYPSGGAPSERVSGTPIGRPDEAEGNKSLNVFLDERVASLVAARKSKGESDFVLCTSHDLAPLLQEACGLSKQHFETRAFKDAYKRWTKEVRKDGKNAR
ncbi:hypothetical protein BN946_scf184533.g5 [Trametes cinnabarina]|uniref:Uncharacterized protein n=1 Tax=Pycnoporus cinnabarinus TaxID=5643 RepID=A0A060SND8_PYCCI|nr:hypothetical protein BN946_scf184533.g5 [Trametes cinnabarina]